MGDFRASIKIDMEIHGKPYKADLWINYAPESSNEPGVDSRVIDFFRDSWEDSLSVYHEQMAEWDAQETERREKAEFERLQQKYAPRHP